MNSIPTIKADPIPSFNNQQPRVIGGGAPAISGGIWDSKDQPVRQSLWDEKPPI